MLLRPMSRSLMLLRPVSVYPIAPHTMSRRTLAWATPLYRTVYDPDGRPLTLRYRHRF